MPIALAPLESEFAGMQSVIGEDELSSLLLRQPPLDQREVAVLVVSVKFVANYRVTEVREVNPNLMLASGLRLYAKEGKIAFVPGKPLGHREVGSRRAAVRSHTIFDHHPAGVVATERFIDTAGIGFDMTVHNGFVRFANVATLPMPAQLSCRIVVFGVQYNPTSLAVEPVDHVHSLRLAKVQPHAADQAAVFVALGWVANQVCWFVDHQQAVILVDDFE